MVTTVQTQQTHWISAVEDDLSHQVEAFLLDRRVRGLTRGTIRFYRQKLTPFQTYSMGQDVGMVSNLTPTLLRQYLLRLLVWRTTAQVSPNSTNVKSGFIKAIAFNDAV